MSAFGIVIFLGILIAIAMILTELMRRQISIFDKKMLFINILKCIIESEQKGSGTFGKISLSEKQ